MLGHLFKSMFGGAPGAQAPDGHGVPPLTASHRLLNVGGGSKAIAIPDHYAGWQHDLLDIDTARNPDIVCDARNLKDLPDAIYDAVYCSHNLEHYYPHDAVEVLAGFLHVLRPGGFAEIRVPDIPGVMRTCVQGNLDIETVLYQSGLGPITARDMIYGLNAEIERSGNDFFAHKTGFSQASLRQLLLKSGFAVVAVLPTKIYLEIRVVAFKQPPDAALRERLGIKN